MNVLRSAAALAAVGVLAAATPAIADGASPSASPKPPALPSGLYGKTDPKYDGVWRQSLALLAQRTVHVTPAPKAVDWLTGQQCASGAFPAFRAEPRKACDAKVMVDTNSTAAAVQALAATGGHSDVTKSAIAWLKSAQNKDGGWGYTAGGPSDANSTAVVIGALAATGTKPADVVKDGKSPYDALLTFALPCSGDDAGAFAYQPDKKGKLAANADATAAAVLGALGQGMAAGAGKDAAKEDGKKAGAGCTDSGKATPERAAANGAAYLADAVAKTGHLTSVMPGADAQPDFGNTADAVVALAAQGGTERTGKPLKWLEKNASAWAGQSGPAAYAQLIFAAHAAGTDPHDFGGMDLVRALNATGPAPAVQPKPKPAVEDEQKSGGRGWWIGGAGLVAGIGVGLLYSGRKKKQQQA